MTGLGAAWVTVKWITLFTWITLLSRVDEIHLISKSHDFEQLYVTKDTTTDRLVTKLSLVTAHSLVGVSQTKLRQSISQLGHP